MPHKIAVIIPVKDEERSIGALLESLISQTRKPDEIIITDGGSEDRTIEIIERYVVQNHTIRLLKAGHAYPGKGRNLAIEAANSDLIAMTDGGIRLDQHWLERLFAPFERRPDVDVVYGNYEPVADSFFRECLVIASMAPKREIDGVLARSHFIASSMMRKDVWRKVGGFPDYRAAEDRIFMEKIDRQGFKIAYAPNATVYWQIPGDLISTFKRYSLLSMHDLVAKRFRDWHMRVSLMYAVALLVLAIAYFYPAILILLPVAALVRGSHLVFEKTCGRTLAHRLDPRRIPLVTCIMVWIDMAMFWGMICYAARVRCEAEIA